MNMETLAAPLDKASTTAMKLSTADYSSRDRHEWLHQVIGREYANVSITPPRDRQQLFNEMTIYPWQDLKLSVIRSNAITIERSPRQAPLVSQDAYFAVVLLSGRYMLEQNGREVFLQPGDMTLYDATRPHRIHCPDSFSKIIVSIPRTMLMERLAGVEHCTARPVATAQGSGALAANFIRITASQVDHLTTSQFDALSSHGLDLLSQALATARPATFNLSRSRSMSLYRIKDFIRQHLADNSLSTAMVAASTGLSPRYINSLFTDENTSLMRYIWKQRLEKCRKNMLDIEHNGHRLSDIALYAGFSDLAHFSRAFKQQYGHSPREYRQLHRPVPA